MDLSNVCPMAWLTQLFVNLSCVWNRDILNKVSSIHVGHFIFRNCVLKPGSESFNVHIFLANHNDFRHSLFEDFEHSLFWRLGHSLFIPLIIPHVIISMHVSNLSTTSQTHGLGTSADHCIGIGEVFDTETVRDETKTTRPTATVVVGGRYRVGTDCV